MQYKVEKSYKFLNILLFVFVLHLNAKKMQVEMKQMEKKKEMGILEKKYLFFKGMKSF